MKVKNTTPVQTWEVNLPKDEIRESIWAWNGTNFGNAAQNVTESETSYSLLRNHLYCIGTRGQDEFPENPEDPNNPQIPDKDNPESLKGEGSPIILKVLDNWDRLYDMELEPTPED